MTDPKLPDLPPVTTPQYQAKPGDNAGELPYNTANIPRPTNGNGARMRTDLEVTGKYLLTVVDDSNERWSNPEWVAWSVTKLMCLFLVCGGVWLYFKTDLPDEAKVLASSLSMAAGFKLIDSSTQASNKRPNGGQAK